MMIHSFLFCLTMTKNYISLHFTIPLLNTKHRVTVTIDEDRHTHAEDVRVLVGCTRGMYVCRTEPGVWGGTLTCLLGFSKVLQIFLDLFRSDVRFLGLPDFPLNFLRRKMTS